MDEPPSAIPILIVFLVILSAFFSGSEAALLSIGRAKVRALKEGHKPGATFLEWLKAHPRKLIITILIGNNIVNVLIPVLATVWVSQQFGNHILGIVTGVLTIILLVFGEIIPKNVGQMYNVSFALWASPPLYFLTKLLWPIVWVFEKLSNLMIVKKKQDPITEEEVRAMVSLGAEGGAIETEEKELIENVLEFTDTVTEAVMVPRVDMEIMDANTTLGEAVQFFVAHSHSRIPIYEDTVDNIIGIITVKQTLKAWNKYGKTKLIKNVEFKTPLFVPTTKKIADVFRDFQRQRVHMAIVVDEHGGTAGIITMEDILEEVFGEIIDESDVDEGMIRPLTEKSWITPGNIDLEVLAEETGIILGTAEDEDKPLSRFILEQTEEIPERGDVVKTEQADFVIEKMEGHKIVRVRVLKKHGHASKPIAQSTTT